MSANGTAAVSVWTTGTGPNRQAQAATWNGTTWSSAVNLGSTSDLASRPQVAISADGLIARAVWIQTNSGVNRVFGSHWDGRVWSVPVALSAADANAEEPKLAMNLTGDQAAVLWFRSSGPTLRATVSRLSAGTWTAEQILTDAGTPIILPVFDGSIDIADDGGVIMAGWTREVAGTGDYRVESRRWNGTTWAETQSVSGAPDSALQSNAGVLKLNAAGTEATAAWRATTAAGISIRSAVWSGGSWGPATQVQSPVVGNYAPALTVSDSGDRATAVWGNDVDGGSVVVYAASRISGVWSAPVALSSPIALEGIAQIAGSADGRRVVAVWRNRSATTYQAHAATGLDGAWSAGVPLGTASADSLNGVATVATAADGLTAVAGWQQVASSTMTAAASQLSITLVPDAPSSVSGVAGNGRVGVTWMAPGFDGNSAVTGYTVTANPGGNQCTSAATACTIAGLTNGQAYTMTVTATNAVGTSLVSAPSPPVTPKAGLPPAPPAPKKVKKLRAQIKPKLRRAVVRWNAPVNATSYQIRIKRGPKKFGLWANTKPRVTRYQLKRGKRYAVQVRAIGKGGTSPIASVKFKLRRR